MGDNSVLKNHFMKVNRAVVAIIWVIVCYLFVLKITGKYDDYITPIFLFAVSAVATVFSLRKIFTRTTAGILLVSLIMSNILVGYLGSGSSQATSMILVLCIASLYLDRTILLSMGGGLVLFYTVANLIRPIFKGNMVSDFTLMGLTMLILFFVTHWGSNLIAASAKNETKAKELITELESAMEAIKSNTFALDKDIETCNNNVETVHQITNSVSSAIQSMTGDVVSQTESANHINNMMGDANNQISEINEISKQMKKVSIKSNQVVSDGSNKISQMSNQMKIINDAVNKSYTTVKELNDSMEMVTNFLSGITQIAEQTNLLALNAAIEAARAGESGKGFAVVADEIRKLAEQSSSTAKQINKIITEVSEKTEAVLEDVNSGNVATQEGEAIVGQVNESFERIQSSFSDIDECISKEFSRVENVTSLLTLIRDEAERIASISESNSASTEELMATTQEQNASVESIYNLIQGIKESSSNLRSILK
jgi:methyl-accepting chemotaxis protein